MLSAWASVVIPAHNEERVIARTLTALAEGVQPGELDVVVVCNGCTDDTAGAARRAAPRARVLEVPEPSKQHAVAVGNRASTVFPRVHLDADVQISGSDVRRLVRPIQEGALLATGPGRVLVRHGVPRAVGWYYDVWEQLPQVRCGLFGRGVVALSGAGQRRVDALPEMMSDDLGISDAFDADERSIVTEASVLVHPPRTLGDLLRRRVRAATGLVQADQLGVRRPESTTGWRMLGGLVREQPALVWRLPVFLGVGALARARSRRAIRTGDYTTWLRDESSRAGHEGVEDHVRVTS